MQGDSCLDRAAYKGQLKAVDFLLYNGADILGTDLQVVKAVLHAFCQMFVNIVGYCINIHSRGLQALPKAIG